MITDPFMYDRPEHKEIRAKAEQAFSATPDVLGSTSINEVTQHRDSLDTIEQGLQAVLDTHDDAVADLRSAQEKLRKDIDTLEDRIREHRKIQRKDRQMKNRCELESKRCNEAYWALRKGKKINDPDL